MNTIKPLFGSMRPPFLVLAPMCVAVGVGTAYWQNGQVNWLHALLIVIGAVSAHVSVNVFNEYFDFRSGLDAKTQRTPFSGGSGTLQAHPELAKQALALGWLTFAITAGVGAYFTVLRGWQLLPLGIFGLLLLVTYTIWWAYHPVLCLLAPGLGFGVLMVMGTHFALTGSYSLTSLMASLAPTFLVSDLLLLNQFPDAEADKTIGRRHFPITLGRKTSSRIYVAFLALSYLSIVLGVTLNLLPTWSLLGLLTGIFAIQAGSGALKHAENIPALIPSMGMNVIINLLTPLLVAVGLFIH
jgi:1,4-dihydroxy-2-naphthoate octaprenyltransferase